MKTKTKVRMLTGFVIALILLGLLMYYIPKPAQEQTPRKFKVLPPEHREPQPGQLLLPEELPKRKHANI